MPDGFSNKLALLSSPLVAGQLRRPGAVGLLDSLLGGEGALLGGLVAGGAGRVVAGRAVGKNVLRLGVAGAQAVTAVGVGSHFLLI